jgi:hypothetical protein
MALRREAELPARRIRDQARRQAPEIARAFLAAVRGIRDRLTLKDLADLIDQGRFEEALAMIDSVGRTVGGAAGQAMTQSGQAAAAFLSSGKILDVVVSYDQTNTRAVAAIQRSTLRAVREFSAEQRAASRQALTEGIREGLNPRDMARRFRDSIGLTRRQERAVANFRRLLTDQSPEALERRLRDRRFDSTIRTAMRNEKALSTAQVDKMVERYRQRYLIYRSQVIGRTEALRSAHQGTEEMFRQAIDDGQLQANELVRTWNTAADERVRHSHARLNGQRRPLGTGWEVSSTVTLDFPGDPDAPAEETVQCRCCLSTRLIPGGVDAPAK